jgi:lipopolysaccharide/colanic/teichoic acid biosynthesis glycosyltransferase
MSPDVLNNEWTKADDSRITRFGKFLRLSHLDELPQVINILRGDLSIVGPRPEQPHYVEQLSKTIPYYQSRHLVRPGLTGWAQVNYPYGADEIDAFEKLQYEFWYLKHQSMWLDLRIIARTFRHVLGFKGR